NVRRRRQRLPRCLPPSDLIREGAVPCAGRLLSHPPAHAGQIGGRHARCRTDSRRWSVIWRVGPQNVSGLCPTAERMPNARQTGEVTRAAFDLARIGEGLSFAAALDQVRGALDESTAAVI